MFVITSVPTETVFSTYQLVATLNPEPTKSLQEGALLTFDLGPEVPGIALDPEDAFGVGVEGAS